MKTLPQTIFLILMSCTLNGQDLAGQWNGTLNVQGTQLRIVFRVDKTSDQYNAILDSPDQNSSGVNVTTTNFSYPDVRFEISSIGAVYEGTMSDKGITGKWVQSGTSLFLALLKNEDSAFKEKVKN
jgi:uncharacterized protein